MRQRFQYGGCEISADPAAMSQKERCKLAQQILKNATPEELAQALIVMDERGYLDAYLNETGADFEAECRKAGLFDLPASRPVPQPTVSAREMEVAERLDTNNLRKLLEAKGMI